jgi:hypothetical protein
VPEAVAVAEPVGVPLGVGPAEALPLSDVLPVLEGEAPRLSAAVGDRVAVELALAVEDGVGAGVLVPVAVADPVAVCEVVGAAVVLLLKDVLALLEGLAPGLSDDVWDSVTVELALAVEDSVGAGVLLPVAVGDPVEVGEGVGAALTLPD